MKYILLILSIFLTGCTVVPVKQKFPDAPVVLMVKCPQLLKINEDQNDIKTFIGVVVKNYDTYYKCAEKVNGWQEWHKENQKIMNGSSK